MPNAPSAWHNYGTALNSLTHYEDALLALKQSLRQDPYVSDVWCNLGLAYFGLEDFLSAERAFRHAIALNASHAPSHTNLGNALINVLQPEEALQHLERGVELDQGSTHSLRNLALAYLLLGDTRKVGSTTKFALKMRTLRRVSPRLRPRLRDLSAAPGTGSLHWSYGLSKVSVM